MRVGIPIVEPGPFDAFRPRHTEAGPQGAARSARRAPWRLETTLLELLSQLSDTLQDDERSVQLVIRLIRGGWVRTAAGREVQLSPADPPDGRSGRRWALPVDGLRA